MSVNYIFYLYFFIKRSSDCTNIATGFMQSFRLSAAIFICRKCRNNEAAYPAFGLENAMNLKHLTAHWTWLGLSKAISNIKVDLKGLQILTPNLRQHLQDLLYACGLNLTAYRIMVLTAFIYEFICTLLTYYIPSFHSHIPPNKSCKNKSGDITRP